MKNYGWLGEVKDIRAQKYAYSTIAKAVPTPDVLYGWSAPQLDQGATPTCGPHSFVEAYYIARVQNGLEPVLLDPYDLADSYAKKTGQPFSGVYNRIMMEVAAESGVLCKADGKRYTIKAWHSVNISDPQEVENCLAERYAIIVGFPVHQSFEDAINGRVPMPGANDPWLGGHDCTLQGYDRNKHIYYLQNHWKDWGFEGKTFVGRCHFQLLYEYLTELGSDAWVITL